MGASTFFWDLAQHRRLLLTILVLGFGGNLLIGFQVSAIAYPSQDIKGFLNASWVRRHGASLAPETLTLLWSFIVSIYCLGGFLGGLWSGTLIARHGKKESLMWADCIVIAAALLVGFSKMAHSFEMILASRLSYGVAAGICLNTTAPYLVEISPKKLRGFAITMSVVFFTLGKVLGQIMGLREVLGGPSWWPLLLGLSGIPALVQLLLLPLFPESPAYLLLQKGDKEGCLRAMRTLWGEGDPHGHGLQAQVEEIRRESSAASHRGALQVMGDRALRRPLALSILLAFSLQLCGLSAIYFYAFEVFRTARIQEDLIPYVALGTGSCELVAVLLCSAIIDRFGRRILLWGGFGMMALAMALLTLSLSLQDRLPWLSFGSVALIFLFIFFFGVGPSGAAFAVVMEVFSQSVRPPALVVIGCVSWLGFFVSGMGFPFLVESLGYFCFLIFLAVDAGMCAFIYFFLPETKGRSVAEVMSELSRIRLGPKRTSAADRGLCTKL